MKCSNLSKVVGATILTLSLAILPTTVPASAQTDPTTPGTTGDNTQIQGTDNAETGDDGFDWGWLGLIGLGGLAGLAKRGEATRYRDPDPANRSGL